MGPLTQRVLYRELSLLLGFTRQYETVTVRSFMDIRLLQYSVGSHSRKGEMVKQQLVQTVLQQGLCDLAMIQGCTGIHEPIRAGVGAVYQPLPGQNDQAQAGNQASIPTGTLFCYTADKFKVRQLSLSDEDLPSCQYSILFLAHVSTGTNFIAIVFSTDASSYTQQFQPLSSLWHLMHELSIQCPVVVAGECICTLSPASDPFCTDPRINLHLCQPVHIGSGISQSFFATACTALQSVEISHVESLLARPAAATVQYTQNAHTAACRITCSGPPAPGKASTQNDISTSSAFGAVSSSASEDAEKLRALVHAASLVGCISCLRTVLQEEAASTVWPAVCTTQHAAGDHLHLSH